MMDPYMLTKMHEHNRAQIERTRGLRNWRAIRIWSR
jgi:hypothetical protein